jgi:hypothetical protein
VSPQCDIVIADRDVPPLLGSKTYRILPNECVYGVIEVKTGLNQTTLLEACELIKTVKSDPKKAFYPNPGPYGSRTAYGADYPYCPTAGMIFAFDGADIVTLGKHLLKWCSARGPEVRPDSVWILGKGFLLWTNPGNGLIDPSPEQGSGLVAVRAPENEDILFPFVLHLSLHFTTAWMPPLRLMDYAGQTGMGRVTVLRRPDGGRSRGQPALPLRLRSAARDPNVRVRRQRRR